MLTLFQSDKTCSLGELKALMINQIKQLPAKVSPIGDCQKILRFEFRCEPINILSWLHNQKTNTKVYWSDRNEGFEAGGIGIADGLRGGNKIDYNELFTYIDERFRFMAKLL